MDPILWALLVLLLVGPFAFRLRFGGKPRGPGLWL
jgi:hypothetical protein